MLEKGINSNKTKPSDYDYIQKIIIIGDSGVGKSNILLRFCDGKFVQNQMITLGISHAFKTIQVDSVRIRLQIWDTAGQQKFRTLTRSYYRKTNGVIIAFSISSLESFYNVRTWIQDLPQLVRQKTPTFLVGTKKDLEQDRQVSTQDVIQYAKNNDLPYLQCSAKTGQSINQIFQEITKLIKNRLMEKLKDETETESPDNSVTIKQFIKSTKKKCC